jgi:dGTPase
VASPLEFRERTEERERATLSSWATLAAETKGRDQHEDADPLRTVFQIDRDRILACAAWRSLAHKTAVLPAEAGRSRMHEAIAVAQVSRTLARALQLNEDLAEAVALGQALGATPFAAAGVEALQVATDRVYRAEEQALRVVERLAEDGEGLNLTWETRDGILHREWDGTPAATLEGEVARFARRIVGVALDVEDAERHGLVRAATAGGDGAELGQGYDERVARMLTDVVRESVDRPELSMSAHVAERSGAMAGAARAGLAGRAAAITEHARAVHCVASVTVFRLEGGAAPGTASISGSSTEAVAVIDEVAAATDAELITAYRAMFEPQLAPGQRG